MYRDTETDVTAYEIHVVRMNPALYDDAHLEDYIQIAYRLSGQMAAANNHPGQTRVLDDAWSMAVQIQRTTGEAPAAILRRVLAH